MKYRIANNKFQTIGFTKSLNDIPSDAAYRSTFLYPEEAVSTWEKTNSVAGFTDVQAKSLWFDIDSNDLTKAKRELTKLIKKLTAKGFHKENMDVRFSGSKGFHVIIPIDKALDPREVQAYCQVLSEGVDGIDTTMYDANQLIRIENTVNQKSGLYCVQLDSRYVDNYDIRTIKDMAATPRPRIEVPEAEVNKNAIPVIEKKVEVAKKRFDLTDLDFYKKPEHLDNARWALQNGYFYGSQSKSNGDRHSAFLCLAATYKNQGFEKEHTYRLLKGVAELQAQRTNEDRFGDIELWNSIISSVYGPNWKGGQYSIYDKTNWLYKYAKEYNIPIEDECGDEPPVQFYDVSQEFTKFINNIEENTVKTGIPQIDKNMPITIGMNLGILGAPSSGKCLAPETQVLMYDGSVKEAQHIVTGELIMGDDSTPRTVLGTTTGQEVMYRIYTNDGYYDVNASHILSLIADKAIGAFQEKEVYNLNVESYLSLTPEEQANLKGWRAPIDYNHKSLDLDPSLYFLYNSKTHIDKRYLINSRSARVRLLNAYLYDGDFTYEHERFALDVQYLCRSLGRSCRFSEGQIFIGDMAEPTYDITVKKLGVGQYCGFELDGNHLFCLADFSVSHNTSLALEILENTSAAGIPGVFVSLDMYRTRIFEKLVYRTTGLSREEVYRIFKEGGEEKQAILDEVQKKYENVYFFDKAGARVEDISKYITHVEKSTGKKIKYALIDYFERIGSSINDATASSLKVSNELQDLINKHQIAGITLVQPNKSSYAGGPDTPLLNYSGIKGSSFLAQSFRSIISVWRPFFNPEWKDYDNYMQMAILKNDLGELGIYSFGWEGKRGMITQLSDDRRKRLKLLLEQKEEQENESKNNRKSGAAW